MADALTLAARYVFPVSGPPLVNGTVTIAGDRLIAVEPSATRRPDFDLGNVAIIPGLVNAHTHLDLTGAAGVAPPSPDFTAWLRQVIRYRGQRAPDLVAEEVSRGIAQCLRHGTTLVGDIAFAGQTAELFKAAPIRSVVFHELIGLSGERAAASWERFRRWRTGTKDTPSCHLGVSPHAPYSAREELYDDAARACVPLTTHVAESREEGDLLDDRSGPFVRFLQELGAWAPDGLSTNWDAVLQHCASAPTALFAHCNYLAPEIAIPANGTVVYCPRTHAAFGHAPHPFRQLLARGVRVALGTDSLASNPDLSLLAEARYIHSICPDVPGDVLLRMGTLSGAEALGFADVAGTLAPGKSADFAILALPPRDASDPHDLLFASDAPVLATVFRGQRIIAGGDTQRALPPLPLPSVALA